MVIGIKGGGDPLDRSTAVSAKPKRSDKPAVRSRAPSVLSQAVIAPTGETMPVLVRLPVGLVARLDDERFARKAASRTDLIRALLEEALGK